MQKRADLQGLRGIAILFVLVMHLKPNSYRLGFVGVDIFFVLSGFLMAKILLERKLTLWSICYFYSRRFKRIVPLYILFVVSVYIFGYFYVLRSDRKQILDDLTWAYTYSSNLQPIFQKLGYWDQISYGFLLSRVWQFMCGWIAYEFSEPAFSSKGKILPHQEEQNSSGEARKQEQIDLSYEVPNAGLLSGSSLTNILLFILVVMVIISPKYVPDNTARICSTLMASLMVYLSSDAFV
ncbi:unnamed protein product [Cylicocyclus nassatus]|uniref:Acyltransferase 3 domain-containing protein n=1 Tax=Cylicocyclus nassatus TaxID=53992 RepID=A0AA36H7D5_CYLNA|nr:unnamed protein product [Cylicocyclus nassatus]